MDRKTPNTISYFAYGSNMCLLHLREWLRRFGVQPGEVGNPRCAILPDHRLRTNYLTTSGIGALNIEPSQGDIVEGLLLTVSLAAREALRAKEGWPRRYQEIGVEVVLPSRCRKIQAITYQVAEEHRLPFDAPVSPRYRNLVLEGARAARLSSSYQTFLANLVKIPMSPRRECAPGQDRRTAFLEFLDAESRRD